MSKNKGFVGLILVLAVAVFFFWLIVIVPIFGLHVKTSNGSHVGYVTATEKSGVFFKTGTAYVKTDVQSSQEDAYCVIDDEVFNQLKELAAKKEKVELEYFGYFSAGIKNCAAEGEIIFAVKELTN